MTNEPYTTPKSKMTNKHWQAFHAKTDEDIMRDIAEDPDADVPVDLSDMSKFRVRHPEGKSDSGFLRVPVESKVASWLEAHHLDGGKLAATLLAQFVAAQSGSADAR